MRPVAKGQPPHANFARYRDALDDLAGQIGLFCNYCEQPIQHAPEVEHVQPEGLEPGLERSWENLLLGCKSCNSTKSVKPVDLDRVAMPDSDNTFRGLVFLEGGRIGLAPGLTDTRAELMRHVVGPVRLDRNPDAESKDDQPTDRDKRADLRWDVWDLAHRYLRLVEQPEMDPLICNLIAGDLAPAKGFFSVWMTVFRDHPEMLKRFIQTFPGTDACSFNDEGQAVPRPGGRL